MFKSTLEKLDYLLNLDTEKQEIDFHIVRQLSNDTDAEVRSQCAETLTLIPCEESESILVSLLDDADNLVRANACDSLKFSHSKLIVKKFISMLSDTSYLVRGYATLTIADILANILSLIHI